MRNRVIPRKRDEGDRKQGVIYDDECQLHPLRRVYNAARNVLRTDDAIANLPADADSAANALHSFCSDLRDAAQEVIDSLENGTYVPFADPVWRDRGDIKPPTIHTREEKSAKKRESMKKLE